MEKVYRLHFSAWLFTLTAALATGKYLIVTEFEVRAVSYGPSFFPLRFMAQARSARAINREGKTRISGHEERLQISQSGRKHDESI